MGVTTRNSYDPAGRIWQVERLGTDGTNRPSMVQSLASYDRAGRNVFQTNALGQRTGYTYAADLQTGTTINTTVQYTNASLGLTNQQMLARDGSVLQLSGNAVHGLKYDYGVQWNTLYTVETKLDATNGLTAECITNSTDTLGRAFKTSYPDGAFSRSYFNSVGQLRKQVDPDGVTTLYQYNGKGELEYTCLSSNRSDTIDFTHDRITRQVSFVTSNAHGVVNAAQTYIWPTDGSSQSVLAAATETSADGLRSWQSSFGVTNRSVTVYGAGGIRVVTNTAPDGTMSIRPQVIGLFADGWHGRLSAKDFCDHTARTAVVGVCWIWPGWYRKS